MAGERDLEAAAEGGTFDCGDDRRGRAPTDDAVLPAPVGRRAGPFRNVGACAEDRRSAGDHDRSDGGVILAGVERSADRFGHFAVDGVALLVAVELDDEHATVAFGLDGHAPTVVLPWGTRPPHDLAARRTRREAEGETRRLSRSVGSDEQPRRALRAFGRDPVRRAGPTRRPDDRRRPCARPSGGRFAASPR